MTNGYGGPGGIAQYNRDLLDALDEIPEVEAIVSLPRLVPDKVWRLPAKVREDATPRSVPGYVLRALILGLSGKPTVILCGHINLLPVAAVLKRILRIPLVIELYGIEVWSSRSSRFLRWCTRQVDMAISISRFTRQKFLGWASVFPAKVRVVPNAIHLDQYMPGPKPAHLEARYSVQGRKVLLTLGRLAASEGYKGQDRIIREMPALLQAQPNIVYLIAGDGDDRGRLERLACECGVSDRVRFIGNVPDNEMMDVYNLADAFAMPSTGEGFGFVFLEAAACGVPVLGGSVDGSPDALADGRIGIMVDPNDGQAVCSGILRLLDQPKQVPTELDAYSFENFKAQISDLVLHVCKAPLRSPEVPQ